MDSLDEVLRSIYFAPGGKTGARQLWINAKEEIEEKGLKLRISQEAVQHWLKRQETYQTNAPNGLDKPWNRFQITDEPNSYQADAIIEDSLKTANSGFRGFLLFVEITTRKAFAFPFKTGSEQSPPTAEESLSIFKKFEADRMAAGHPIRKITGDRGKELTNSKVQTFFKEHEILTWFHRPEDHRANGLLNSVARYIRRLVHMDLYDSGSGRWLDNLQHAVDAWNKHTPTSRSALPAKPNVMAEDKAKQQQVRMAALEHNRSVWDKTELTNHTVVKRYLRRDTKDKGKWAKEGANFEGEYRITGRVGNSYALEDDKGFALPQTYRPYELRTVPHPHHFGNAVPEKPVQALKRQARVERKVKEAVGKGYSERIVNEKREGRAPKPVEEVVSTEKQRKENGPVKAAAKKGEVLRVVERVLTHKVKDKQLFFKVKWEHLSAKESRALEWLPLTNFEEVRKGITYTNPVIYKYMEKHNLF